MVISEIIAIAVWVNLIPLGGLFQATTLAIIKRERLVRRILFTSLAKLTIFLRFQAGCLICLLPAAASLVDIAAPLNRKHHERIV